MKNCTAKQMKSLYDIIQVCKQLLFPFHNKKNITNRQYKRRIFLVFYHPLCLFMLMINWEK
jgi:hypothetical protein